MNDLKTIRVRADELLARRSHAVRQVRDEKRALAEAKADLAASEEAQRIVQAVAQKVQDEAHAQIASVVSRCLWAVFGDRAYQFKILFERKRGRTEAKLVFERKGLTLDDPANQGGGGQIDVAAFALRLAALMLARPARRKTLLLDEPFKWVNGEQYQQRVGELVLELSRELGIQFVIVTDDDWLKVGKVVELG